MDQLIPELRFGSCQVLLDEAGAEMHVHLDQRLVANAAETVDLSGLDDQDIARASLKFLSVDGPETPALSDELNFIVRVTVRTRATAWQGAKKKHRDVHVTIVAPDELVRTTLKRQLVLFDAVHRRILLLSAA
jgi:hypothetical protein